MLSEKIDSLFELLSCTNVEIAEYAECDRSYISHIRRGSRKLSPSSRAIARLAEGVYLYADNENMLSVLCELCKVDNESRESLIPALVAWLFDTEETELPQIAKIPKKRSLQEEKAAEDTHGFGEKLDAVMQLLELSNARLARRLNVDNSLVSRFRCGVRSPRNNQQMSEEITEILLERAIEQNRLDGLSRLCGISEELLADDENGRGLFSKWLYSSGSESDTSVIDNLLESIDSFAYTKRPDLPEYEPSLLDFEERDIYWGNEGLRAAVCRFLSAAAEGGGTLYLYSDEDQEWLSGDPSFFNKWAALMLACLKKGVKMKIIHNVDRDMDEMLTAISGWMPLYMSGMIEPHVCKRPRDTRFVRTFFLYPGKACIHGSFTRGAGDEKWYDYITDPEKLDSLRQDYQRLLDSSDDLLKIYLDHQSWRLFRNFPISGSEDKKILLTGLSPATIPAELLDRMLERQLEDEEEKQRIKEAHRARQAQFKEALEHGHVYEFVELPDDPDLFAGEVRLNLGTELLESDVRYTPEEYAEHVEAVIRLLNRKKQYHLLILPEVPFPDIQVVLADKEVAIIRSKSPYAGFVFSEPLLCHAVGVYFDMLEKKYRKSRSAVRQKLKRFY